MFDEKVIVKPMDRRSFLRGSALFAAALGASVATSAFAQEQQPKPDPEEEKKKPEDGKKEDDGKKKEEPPPGTDTETKIDADGREYRVCPQCGANMYKQGRTWTCENCGYSYVE
jgi:ribosomal protein S27AE